MESTSTIGTTSKTEFIMDTHWVKFKMGRLTLNNVMYSPDISVNLITTDLIHDMGYTIECTARHATIIDQKGSHLLSFEHNPNDGRLWQTMVRTSSSNKAFVTEAYLTKPELATLWHQILGHLHPTCVILYLKLIGVGGISARAFSFCDSCALLLPAPFTVQRLFWLVSIVICLVPLILLHWGERNISCHLLKILQDTILFISLAPNMRPSQLSITFRTGWNPTRSKNTQAEDRPWWVVLFNIVPRSLEYHGSWHQKGASKTPDHQFSGGMLQSNLTR